MEDTSQTAGDHRSSGDGNGNGVGRAIAAIDIGTNSIHMVVARPAGRGRFETIDRVKEVVRLGSGSGDMKALAPEAIERGVACLARFRVLADASDAEVFAVATSAVREAENREEFLRRARAEAGVEVEVIAGVEEARLIRLGALQAVPVYDRRHLVIDIGGGSTELIVGCGDEVLVARSAKLGAIRMTERFGLAQAVTPKVVAEARRFVRSYLHQTVRDVASVGFDVTVGSSGTIENLLQIARGLQGCSPALKLSGQALTTEGVAAVVDALVAAGDGEGRLRVPGMDPTRADILLGGALVLQQALADLGVEEVRFSETALREGLVVDVLARRAEASYGHLGAVRFHSVRHLAAAVPEEGDHAEVATDLALQLFEATAAVHGLGAADEELLHAAGLLANVGLLVSHDKHHRHSYYIIRNSDRLTGFTDHEIELIALIARYHRKSAPKSSHLEFVGLDDADKHRVKVLAGLLRLGIALDRTRRAAVATLDITVDEAGITIEVTPAEGTDASLELYTAAARRDLAEHALGLPVQVIWRDPTSCAGPPPETA